MEAVLDIGNHLIADRGLGVPDTFKGVFKTLADAGLIPDSLGGQLQLWAGFRNVLVHEYLGIDHGIVYDTLSNDLGTLEEFARIAAGLLD